MTPCRWGEVDQPWSRHRLSPVLWRPLASPSSSFGLSFPSPWLIPWCSWVAIIQGLCQSALGRTLDGGNGRMGWCLQRELSVWKRGWSLRMRCSYLATAASSSRGALIPDCTRAPAQVCPLLINDV